MSKLLECHNVGLTIGNNEILRNIRFSMAKNARIAIVGPSGCGKTSLLHLLAGLRLPTLGQIIYKNQPLRKPSRERVVIFQNYALFPWKTAGENIVFALRARGERSHLREQAQEYLTLFGLQSAYSLYPYELSGGMQQRVGIARGLAAQPEILLLDEPFAALDTLTKDSVLEDVVRTMNASNSGLILVTHNIEEALFMADRVLVMASTPGRIVEDILVPHNKPERWIDFKHEKNYLELESQIYDCLQSTHGGLA